MNENQSPAPPNPLPPAPPNPSPEGKKRGRGKFVLLGGAMLLVILGAGVGWAVHKEWIPIGASHEQSQKEELGEMVKLSSTIINLKGDGGRHYLKTTVVMEVGKKEKPEEIQVMTSLLADIAISTICEKQLVDLVQPECKENLKREMLRRANRSMGEGRIKKIYFDEFIFQ